MIQDSQLTCPACRWAGAPESGFLSCPQARPGEDHTLRRRLTFAPGAGAAPLRDWEAHWRDGVFRAFGCLISARPVLGRDGYLGVLESVSESLLRFEGRGLEVTPLTEAPALAAAAGRTGRLWIKDETGNVAGSHKVRHLMGSLLMLEALRESKRAGSKKDLAIYSCGNAALAAAAVARAAGYALHAFVPAEVDPLVARMFAVRGAAVEKIARTGTGKGDPCYLAFRKAVAEKGWVPFACSGSDNWPNIEGGATLGWELVMQLAERGATIEAAVIQAGGGALARAIAQAFEEAFELGLISRLPRLNVCQPEGGFPFVRAYLLVLAELAARCGLPFDFIYDRKADPSAALRGLAAFAGTHQGRLRQAAEAVRERYDSAEVSGFLDRLPVRAREYMWPWDGPEPQSLAHGILDDVTYDWYWLLRAVLRSGGSVFIVREATLGRAWRLAKEKTGIPVCPTGAAGFAGLLELEAAGAIGRGESVGLFFTGLDRGGSE